MGLRRELNRRNGAALDKGKALSRAGMRSATSERQSSANLGRFLRPGYHGRWWTKAELRLLGKLSDDTVARRTGRPVNGVRIMTEAAWESHRQWTGGGGRIGRVRASESY